MKEGGVLPFFKGESGDLVIKAALENIEWLYSDEAKAATLEELEAKNDYLKHAMGGAKERFEFHKDKTDILVDFKKNIEQAQSIWDAGH